MKKSTKALLGTAAAAAAVSVGSGFLIFDIVMNRDDIIFKKAASVIQSKKDMVKTERLVNDPRELWYKEQTPEHLEIINDKQFRLKSKLFKAEQESKVFVLCSHGYRSTGDGEYGAMAKFYHDLGCNVLIVDHQAHGESDGKYIGFGYHEYKDCIIWLNYLIDRFGSDIQIILEGISMGSATVMMMTGAPDLPKNVKFTVADCGYTSAYDEFEFCLKNYIHLPKFPILYSADMFNKSINGYAFKDASPIDAVANAKIPMLFIHGDADDFVPTYMVHQLYAACSSEYKDLLLIEGAGHAESYRRDSEKYESKVKEFFDKFIEQ